MIRRPPAFLCNLFCLGAVLLLAGCIAPQVSEGEIGVSVTADGEKVQVQLPAGSTVDQALRAAGIAPGGLDKAEPPLYTVLSDGSKVRLIRVTEEFTIEQQVIPFEQQVVRNEALPAGQEHWLQIGQNGMEEITIRKVFEDGVEISNGPVKSVVIREPVPQIKMVGVQKAFAPVPIPGRLAYLVDGDAWVMEGTTGNRRMVVDTGDLDGRIFSLSPDGDWLLFSRRFEEDGNINNLWAVNLDQETSAIIDLKVNNVVHFADWRPGVAQTIGYSTVEPRLAAPGWQANNDLQLLSFSASGYIRNLPAVLETNSGGVYGWWGTDYSWAPDGQRLAYARPDGIGLLDLETGETSPLIDYTPVQTFGDWAWVPGIDWDPQGDFLYTVYHPAPAEGQRFDLTVASLAGGQLVDLTPDVGMFAYPVSSPLVTLPSGEQTSQVAYLQASFPSQSESSRYRLMVMDRDGSNRRALFPAEGAGGLEPQKVAWSPEPLKDSSGFALAVLYENNLWLVDSETGETWQVTGDGLTSRLDWK